MSKVLFNSLPEALAAVTSGDERQLLLVKFKAKEFFTLAESPDEALGEVARHLGAECGAVPLDLILAAHREQLAPVKVTATGPVVMTPPAAPNKIKLSSLGVAELKEIYRGQIFGKVAGAPETATLKRADLVYAIAQHKGDMYADDKMEGVAPPAADAPAPAAAK